MKSKPPCLYRASGARHFPRHYGVPRLPVQLPRLGGGACSKGRRQRGGLTPGARPASLQGQNEPRTTAPLMDHRPVPSSCSPSASPCRGAVTCSAGCCGSTRLTMPGTSSASGWSGTWRDRGSSSTRRARPCGNAHPQRRTPRRTSLSRGALLQPLELGLGPHPAAPWRLPGAATGCRAMGGIAAAAVSPAGASRKGLHSPFWRCADRGASV
jgi:hypothetical protein